MVMQYEPNIEQRLLHLRARSGHLLSFYMKNFADKGTTFFMDVLRYVVSDEPQASISEVTTTGGKKGFGRGWQLPLVAVAQPRPKQRD
jgi:hypothetical protein